MTDNKMGQVIQFRSYSEKEREELGLRLLSLGRDLANKAFKLGEFLGSGDYPTYIDDEVLEIEIMAFEALNLDRGNANLFELHQDYILGDINEAEFLEKAKIIRKLGGMK